MNHNLPNFIDSNRFVHSLSAANYERQIRTGIVGSAAFVSLYLKKTLCRIAHCHAAMTAEKQHSFLQSNKISNNLKPLQP